MIKNSLRMTAFNNSIICRKSDLKVVICNDIFHFSYHWFVGNVMCEDSWFEFRKQAKGEKYIKYFSHLLHSLQNETDQVFVRLTTMTQLLHFHFIFISAIYYTVASEKKSIARKWRCNLYNTAFIHKLKGCNSTKDTHYC